MGDPGGACFAAVFAPKRYSYFFLLLQGEEISWEAGYWIHLEEPLGWKTLSGAEISYGELKTLFLIYSGSSAGQSSRGQGQLGSKLLLMCGFTVA